MVGILGRSASGKTHTWNLLFNQKEVKTGKNLRKLVLNEKGDSTEVFVVSRSATKRKIDIRQIVKVKDPSIVLCSLQYAKGVKNVIKFFADRGYFLYIHWLDPGYADKDDKTLFYDSAVLNEVLSFPSVIGVRNGKEDAAARVNELRDYIWGWARVNGQLKEKKIRTSRKTTGSEQEKTE